MKDVAPHYLLFSETRFPSEAGRWRFVLRIAGGLEEFEASDCEPEVCGERLELLCVVRALESLDQPSCVTLMSPGNYVRHGLRFGLPEWRTNGWRWEYFGQMVPIKHGDLWQRLDRLLGFHQVDFCRYRNDPPHRGILSGHSHDRRGGQGHRGRGWQRMLEMVSGAKRRLHRVHRWWRRRWERSQTIRWGVVGQGS
jgi:ribonuclease HI